MIACLHSFRIRDASTESENQLTAGGGDAAFLEGSGRSGLTARLRTLFSGCRCTLAHNGFDRSDDEERL